jgi:hypothetical protein
MYSQCPYCNSFSKIDFEKRTFVFNPVMYSDGYEHKTNSDQLKIVLCPNSSCNKFFKISGQYSVNQIEDESIDSSQRTILIKDRDYDIKGLLELLEKEELTDFELDIRKHLLWELNDLIREDEKADLPIELADIDVHNKKRLVELLRHKTEQKDLLLLAEIYRELGNFSNCESIITGIKKINPKYKSIANRIYYKSRLKEDRVFCLNRFTNRVEFVCDNCGDVRIVENDKNSFLKDPVKYYYCEKDDKIFLLKSRELNKFFQLGSSKYARRYNLLGRHSKYKPSLNRCENCNDVLEEVKLDNAGCLKCNGKYRRINRLNI